VADAAAGLPRSNSSKYQKFVPSWRKTVHVESAGSDVATTAIS
jgi:hypothetical protein